MSRRPRWKREGKWFTSWRALLREELERRGETLGRNIIAIETRDQVSLDAEMSGGYSITFDREFTAWSEAFVYFASNYDGMATVESARRHPPAELLERDL